MRLFIAVNFNDSTRARIAALRDELRARSERGNFSLSENLHLTLVFLGECDAKQTAAAISALDSIRFSPFEIRVERVGRFKRGGGDIWWAGLSENKQLTDLHRELTDKLIAAGFALEKREYRPHVTIGREVVTDAVPRKTEPFGETASAIDLMKSERVSGRLVYTPIYRKMSG